MAALWLFLLIPAVLAAGDEGIPATFQGALTGDVITLRLSLDGGEPRDVTVVLRGVIAPQPGIVCPDGRRTMAVLALARRARAFVVERLSAAGSIRVHDPEPAPRGARFASVTVDGEDLGDLLVGAGLAQRARPGERVQWCAE